MKNTTHDTASIPVSTHSVPPENPANDMAICAVITDTPVHIRHSLKNPAARTAFSPSARIIRAADAGHLLAAIPENISTCPAIITAARMSGTGIARFSTGAILFFTAYSKAVAYGQHNRLETAVRGQAAVVLHYDMRVLVLRVHGFDNLTVPQYVVR